MSFNPITVAQGADGYLTFFTGTDGLAGDNDATYSRVTGTIRTVGAFQGSPSISGTGVGGVGHTGTAFIWDAVSNAGASGGISSRFDTSFQSQTDVYRWRIGGNFTPAGVAFGFFDNVPNIWMKTGTPPLTGFNEVAPVNVIDVGGGMVIGTTYAGTNTAPSNGLLVEGNVGLGTTSPQNKLDIEGAAAIGAGYSGTSTAPTNGLIVEGSVGVGTTTPDQTLHVHKGTAGTVSANASSVIVMENSVNAYLHMLTPHANESGILAGGPDSSIKTALLFNNQAAINFRSGGNTTRMTLSADGNLGIGPASGTPHATLTVNGNIALQEQAIDPPFQDGYGYLYVRDDDKLYYKDGAGVEFDLTSGGGVSATQGSDGYLSFFTGANTIAGDNDLYWDRVNNILGIGISNPSSISPNATLSVASPHESVRINVVSGVAQGTATIGFYGSPTSFAYAGVVAYHTNQGDGGSGHLAFNTDDGTSHQERMRILDTGNIGIGTASPHEKLTLNGVMSLQEQDTYNRTFDGYGSLWAKSDGSIHFTNDAGTDYNLTAAAGLSAEQGADGYIAFFTSGNTLAGDNDLYFDRVNNNLVLGHRLIVPSIDDAENPTIALGDGDTGLYELADDILAISLAGVTQFIAAGSSLSGLSTNSGAILNVSGSATIPTLIPIRTSSDMGMGGSSEGLSLITNNVQRVEIESNSGRVGIATSTPEAQLHVAGDGYFDGYLMPFTDNMWGLGTPDKRWRDLYLGPNSLHIVSKSTDGGRPNRTFTWNVSEAGTLELMADSTTVASFNKDDGASFPQGGGGGVSSVQGSDGYLAFFIGSDTIAGDNDLFYNRTTGQLQVTSDAVAPININHTGVGAALHIIDDNVSSILMQRTVATTAQWALAMATDGVFLIRDMETSNSIIAIQKAAPTGSIYIESTGDVGFSTLTPVARLELEDNATANGMIMKVTADDHNVYGIIIGNDTFSTTDANGLGLYLSNAGVSVIDAAGTSTSLSLQIAATERVRITTTGVGLGTAAPQNRLDVEGAAVVGVTYSGTNTAPSNGMLIEGAIGIGTSSPDTTNTKVEIQQTLSSTTTSSLFLENTSTGDVMLTLGLTGARYYSWGIDNSDADKFKLATATAMGSGVDTNTIMVVTSTGDVGVGGTPVNGRFEVNTAADAAVASTAYASAAGVNARGVLQARANGGGVILGMNNTTHSEYTRGGENMNGAAELVTFNSGDAVTKLLIGNVNASPIHFITNNAKVMTISSDSLVGIKTATPIEALTVNGAVALQEQESAPATQDGYGKLYTSFDGDLTYKDDGGSVVQITHADGYVNWTPSWINVIVKDADTGGDANERTIPTDTFWTGGAVDATITGKGIYFQTNNGQFNVTKSGIYRFFARIPWSDSDTNTGNITFRLKKNDGSIVWLNDERWNNSTDVSPKYTVIDTLVELVAGDTLEISWNPRNTAAVINPLGSWFTMGMEQISM